MVQEACNRNPHYTKQTTSFKRETFKKWNIKNALILAINLQDMRPMAETFAI